MARTKQTHRIPSKTPDPQPQALSPLPTNTQAILRTGPEAVAYHIPTSPSSPSNPILKTTIALPKYSKWTSGLHFHTRHTEYLHLLRGAIWVHLNGEEKIISAQAGGEVWIGTGTRKPNGVGVVIEVPRYARHEWRRAQMYYGGYPRRSSAPEKKPDDVDDEVVVEEWTDPSDLGKPLFFWNLNGVITDPVADNALSMPQRIVKSTLRSWWIPFQLFVIFWDLDNWPVLLGLRGLVGGQSKVEQLAYKYLEGPAEYAMTLAVLFAAKVLGWLVGIRAVEQRRTPGELWRAYVRS